jgi:transposase-like protein
MRREIRRALRQIELLGQCPQCEIDAETIGEQLFWNGAKRHIKCPDCGYEFQIEFRIIGNRFQAQVIPPDKRRMIDLEITDEEREYLRHELGKLKPT